MGGSSWKPPWREGPEVDKWGRIGAHGSRCGHSVAEQPGIGCV